MARQNVMTPASKGGSANIKKHDEFTWDEFLDDIANRRQEQSESSRRSKSFSDAFKSMLVSPQGRSGGQDEEYEKDLIRSDWINGQERLRQEQEALTAAARQHASPEFGPSSAAMYEYIKGGQRGPTPGLTIEDYREMKKDAVTSWFQGDPANRQHWENEIDRITEDLHLLGFDGPGEHAPPEEKSYYSHDNLIKAAGGVNRLTKKDLEWLELMDEEIETGRVTDDEMNDYMRLQHIRDRAKASILDSWEI